MKIGILPRQFNDWAIEKVLKYVSGLGYEAIEIHAWMSYHPEDTRLNTQHIDLDEVIKDKGKKYKKMLDKYNLTVSSVTDHKSTKYSLDPDINVAKQSKEQVKKLVDVAVLLDAPCIVGFCGDHGGRWYGASKRFWNEAWANYREVWSELLDYFAKNDVKFAMEVHSGNLAYNVETAERAIKEVGGRKELGINFDPSQMLWQGLDPATFIYEFANRIIHVHAKDQEKNPRIQLSKMGYLTSQDTRATGTIGFRDRVPGWGDVNWKKMITALGEVGYTGVLSFEFNSDPLFNREEATERAIAFLKPLIPKE